MVQSCGMGILPVLVLLAGKMVLLAGKMPALQEILGYFFIQEVSNVKKDKLSQIRQDCYILSGKIEYLFVAKNC